MGEVDTKPIESVQAAIALFGELKQQFEGKIDEGLEVLQKELASCKVQLEAKESAYMQSLLKLQHYDERGSVLSSQLMKSELERDVSMGELREARACIKELEYELKETTEHLYKGANAREQLLGELNASYAQQLSMEAVIAIERESKNKAVKQAEILANVEKEKLESLLKHVKELDETIHMLKAAALEAEAEKSRILLEKEAKIELATSAALKMREELDHMERRLDFIRELENQVFSKSMTIESLQSDLKSLREEVAQATKYAEELRGELEAKEREASDRAVDVDMLEVELIQLKEAAAKSKEDNLLSHEVHTVRKKCLSTEIELSEFEDQGIRVQAEIATLKAELHQARSRLAAAEAAEVKAEGVRSGLYLAVQQLAGESEEVKNENRRLKQAVAERGDPLEEKLTFNKEAFADAADEALREKNSKEDAQVTLSLVEYEALILKAKKADEIPSQLAQDASKHETEMLKRDLKVVQAKVGEFRTRVEQALARAEAAERDRAALEDQMSRRRDKKQRRKAALAALREASITRESLTPPCGEGTAMMSTPQIPLWKVLNMRYY